MKLGLIGTGWIVQRQLPQMRGRGIEVGALAGTPRSAEKVEALAEANGVPGRYTDYRQMIAEADIDTVYVGIPNALHLEACTAALEAGKHVICEKPVASNYAEAKAMADLARSRNLFLWEAVSTIYLPNVAKLRELLAAPEAMKLRDSLAERQVFTEEEASWIRPEAVERFFASDIGKRMLASPEVHREWEFNLAVRERGMMVRDALMERLPLKDVILLDTRGISSLYASDGGIIVVV